jgi:hypothetical protein
MEEYIKKLMEMGLSYSRAETIAETVNKLNAAICSLDNGELHAFARGTDLSGHLDMFAKCTSDRNVAKELYMIQLRKAVREIDFDEFEEFSDKLSYLAEQASETHLPGAALLCKSLTDISKVYKLSTNFFHRMAHYALNVAQVAGYTYWAELNLHISGPYKDCYSHLNDERHIGEVRTLQRFERDKEKSYESGHALLFIEVQNIDDDVTLLELQTAIAKAYTRGSCTHEHDCCGCVRESVLSMKHLLNSCDHQVWAVRTSWGRVQ